MTPGSTICICAKVTSRVEEYHDRISNGVFRVPAISSADIEWR